MDMEEGQRFLNLFTFEEGGKQKVDLYSDLDKNNRKIREKMIA